MRPSLRAWGRRGLGIVLSPRDNPGYLPGMNSGAFNLGAGLSFAVLFAASTAVTGAAGPRAGYLGGIATGAVIVILAILASLLIPKPAEVHASDKGGN